jgi:hypothetical protein
MTLRLKLNFYSSKGHTYIIRYDIGSVNEVVGEIERMGRDPNCPLGRTESLFLIGRVVVGATETLQKLAEES